jgi:5'-methylthioinosine phosphorylase
MKLAVIGGSGFGEFAGLERIRSHRTMTPWGEPSAAVTACVLNGVDLLFLPRHGAGHHLPPHRINYRANVGALARLGADTIVATAAVGGIAATATPGVVVMPDQLIDYTRDREHTYFDGSQSQPQHVDFTQPYSPALRDKLSAAAASAGVSMLEQGVYATTQGPRLETAAEIDRLERDGCTIVGMTGMPEAALARELGIDYANLSLVVNAAAGRAAGPITMQSIERESSRGMAKIRAIIDAFTRLFA